MVCLWCCDCGMVCLCGVACVWIIRECVWCVCDVVYVCGVWGGVCGVVTVL